MAGQVSHLTRFPTANYSSTHQSYSTHARHTHGTQQTTNLGEYSPQAAHTHRAYYRHATHSGPHGMCSLVPPFYVWQLRQPRLTNWSDHTCPATRKHEFRRKWQQTDQQAEGNEVTVTGSMGVQGALYIIFIFIYIIYNLNIIYPVTLLPRPPISDGKRR